MKYILPFLMLCVFALPLMAQDEAIESYIYQGNPLCEFGITIQAHTALEYHLTFDGATASEGTADAGDEIELRIPISGQWFILVIEHAADENPYTLTSGLACGDESETGGDVQHIAPVDPLLQERMKELEPLLNDLMRLILDK